MEQIFEKEPRSKLVTAISYMSHIMVYYGYMHEWAELFRQLSKKTRQTFDENVSLMFNHAHFKDIVDHKNFRLRMDITLNISKRLIEHLQKTKNYMYYWLNMNIGGNDNIAIATQFIKQLKDYPKSLFDWVNIVVTENNYKEVNEFLDAYIEKGFNISTISADISERKWVYWNKVKGSSPKLSYLSEYYLRTRNMTLATHKCYKLNFYPSAVMNLKDCTQLEFKELDISSDHLAFFISNKDLFNTSKCTFIDKKSSIYLWII